MKLKKIEPQTKTDKRRFAQNEDAVSITVGFILTLSISMVVFSVIIISFYDLTQRSEKEASLASFGTLGSDLAVKITTMDTLANITNSYGGKVNSFEYDFSVPSTIALEDYSINVMNSTKQIIIQSNNGAVAWIPFNTSSGITQTTIYSGAQNYKFTYSNNNITTGGQ